MTTFNGVPPYSGTNLQEWILNARIAINGCINGKTNNTDTFTLTANSATTAVTLAEGRLGINTVVVWTPTTAHAATEAGAGAMYLSGRNVANGTFTITHTNNAQTDRTFIFILVG